ncbi:Adenylyltransferase and sulfurtransferase MOCS3 [Orchesella cincta]|uniref:Adenylyltransferase and sulfurtransferase MOCS3 n=1 Tax=Orchesella cincta TaxID=48709 RepID=A0A1D2MDX7_ORCCI|nr:Adenylyltransferase and sulfurtransferase MOCS3 [Orchesella cincta]
MSLSNQEISRYSRQMILPELGMKGQQNLKNGSVLVVGLGGLGSPASMFLAASGIGKLGLVDYDVVEISNLHRQVIHGEKTVGVPKAESAKTFLENLNPHVNIEVFKEPFTTANALEIVKNFDVIWTAQTMQLPDIC